MADSSDLPAPASADAPALSAQARAVLSARETALDPVRTGASVSGTAPSGLTDWGAEAIRQLTAELSAAPPPAPAAPRAASPLAPASH